MKLSIILLKYCFFFWAAILICRSIVELLDSLGWHCIHSSCITESFWTLTIVCISIFIWKWKSNNILNSSAEFLSQHNITAHHVPLDKFYQGGKILLNLSLLIILCCLTKSLICHGGRTLAYGADIVGAYELGEHIYSMTASSDGTALASILGPDRHDNNKKELLDNRLNKVVAQIYGATSKQMASRYYNLGCNYSINFHNGIAAEECFNKAVAIYKVHGNLGKCIWPLASLSYAQYQNSEKEKVKKTLDEGLELAPYCAGQKNLTCAFELLMGTAIFSNNNEETKAFSQLIHTTKISTANNSISSFLLHWSSLDYRPLLDYS